MSNQRKYEDELNTLMSFLAESVALMSDSQIEEEFCTEALPGPRSWFSLL